jgi:hypothetical protein
MHKESSPSVHYRNKTSVNTEDFKVSRTLNYYSSKIINYPQSFSKITIREFNPSIASAKTKNSSISATNKEITKVRPMTAVQNMCSIKKYWAPITKKGIYFNFQL